MYCIRHSESVYNPTWFDVGLVWPNQTICSLTPGLVFDDAHTFVSLPFSLLCIPLPLSLTYYPLSLSLNLYRLYYINFHTDVCILYCYFSYLWCSDLFRFNCHHCGKAWAETMDGTFLFINRVLLFNLVIQIVKEGILINFQMPVFGECES